MLLASGQGATVSWIVNNEKVGSGRDKRNSDSMDPSVPQAHPSLYQAQVSGVASLHCGSNHLGWVGLGDMN
jgi:hypothetical protein